MVDLKQKQKPPQNANQQNHLVDDPDGLNKQDYLDDMKQYRHDVADYWHDKPKLYVLIMTYLSDESLSAVQKKSRLECCGV
jgi:hypothetical protein